MPTLAEIRAQEPIFADLDDQQMVNVIHQEFYPSMDKAELSAKLGYKPVEAVKPETGGFIASAKNSLGAAIKGAGQAAADFMPGVVDQDNLVKSYGQEVIDNNPTNIHNLSDMGDRPWMTVKEATGNMAGSVGQMVGLRAAGQGITALAPLTGPAAPAVALLGQAVAWLGPAAVASLPSYGSIRDKQIMNDPADNENWKAKAVAAMGAATVGAIETEFGLQNWALGAMTREGRAALSAKFAETTIAKGVGFGLVKGGAVEGGEELVQSPVEQLSAFESPFTSENIRDTIFGGAMGAVGGGVLGGGMGAISYRAPTILPGTGPLSEAANAGQQAAADALNAAEAERAAQAEQDALATPIPYIPEAPPAPDGLTLQEQTDRDPNSIDFTPSGSAMNTAGMESLQAYGARGNPFDLDALLPLIAQRNEQGEALTIIPHVNGGYTSAPTEKLTPGILNAVKHLQPTADNLVLPPDAQAHNEQKEQELRRSMSAPTGIGELAKLEQLHAEQRALESQSMQDQQQQDTAQFEQDLQQADARRSNADQQRAADERSTVVDGVLGNAAIPNEQKKAVTEQALTEAGYASPQLNDEEHQRIDAATAVLPPLYTPNEIPVSDLVPERKDVQAQRRKSSFAKVDQAIAAGYKLRGKNLVSPTGKPFRLNQEELKHYKSAVNAAANTAPNTVMQAAESLNTPISNTAALPSNATVFDGTPVSESSKVQAAASGAPLTYANAKSSADAATSPLNNLPQPTEAQKEANQAAGNLSVMFGGQSYPVASLEDASAKWTAFRKQSEAGASEIGNGVEVTDASGSVVGSISYNGRIQPVEQAVLPLSAVPPGLSMARALKAKKEAAKATPQAATETVTPVAPAKSEEDAAFDAEMDAALAHLGDVLGDVFGAKLNITGQKHTAGALLPALSKVIDMLVKKGARSLRDALSQSALLMRANAAVAPHVDQISARQWKAAYNAIAEFHDGTDSEEQIAATSAEDVMGMVATVKQDAVKPAVALQAQVKRAGTGAQVARAKLESTDPFRAFLAENGVHPDDRADIGVDRKITAMTPGYGPIFKKSAPRMDILAQRALEAGHLTQADIHSDTDNGGTGKLSDMIRRAVGNREVIRPDEVGAEATHGADAQLMEEAAKLGINTDGKTLDQVYDAVIDAHAEDIDSFAQNDDLQDAIDAAFDAPRQNNTYSDEDIDAIFGFKTETGGKTQDDTAVDARGRDQENGREAGDFSLQGETAAEVTAKEDQSRQDEADKQAAANAAAKAERATQDKKDIASRQNASAENFQLGQSAEESLSGQGDVFNSSQSTNNELTGIDAYGNKSTNKSAYLSKDKIENLLNGKGATLNFIETKKAFANKSKNIDVYTVNHPLIDGNKPHELRSVSFGKDGLMLKDVQAILDLLPSKEEATTRIAQSGLDAMFDDVLTTQQLNRLSVKDMTDAQLTRALTELPKRSKPITREIAARGLNEREQAPPSTQAQAPTLLDARNQLIELRTQAKQERVVDDRLLDRIRRQEKLIAEFEKEAATEPGDEVMVAMGKTNQRMPQGFDVRDEGKSVALFRDGKRTTVYGLSRTIGGIEEALRHASLNAQQVTRNPTTLDQFIGDIDAGYRAHFDYAGAHGRTVWIEKADRGWVLKTKNDDSPAVFTKGSPMGGGWSKFEAMNRAEEDATHRFTQWKQTAEAAPAPVVDSKPVKQLTDITVSVTAFDPDTGSMQTQDMAASTAISEADRKITALKNLLSCLLG